MLSERYNHEHVSNIALTLVFPGLGNSSTLR
jgi:hypothetical protein